MGLYGNIEMLCKAKEEFKQQDISKELFKYSSHDLIKELERRNAIILKNGVIYER